MILWDHIQGFYNELWVTRDSFDLFIQGWHGSGVNGPCDVKWRDVMPALHFRVTCYPGTTLHVRVWISVGGNRKYKRLRKHYTKLALQYLRDQWTGCWLQRWRRRGSAWTFHLSSSKLPIRSNQRHTPETHKQLDYVFASRFEPISTKTTVFMQRPNKTWNVWQPWAEWRRVCDSQISE